MRYIIYKITHKDICTPSEDYYSRHGDWDRNSINVLESYEAFPTMEECIKYLETEKPKGQFTILPVFEIE